MGLGSFGNSAFGPHDEASRETAVRSITPQEPFDFDD